MGNLIFLRGEGRERGHVLSCHIRRLRRPSGTVDWLAPTHCDVFEVLRNAGRLRPVDRGIPTAGVKFQNLGKDIPLKRI